MINTGAYEMYTVHRYIDIILKCCQYVQGCILIFFSSKIKKNIEKNLFTNYIYNKKRHER